MTYASYKFYQNPYCGTDLTEEEWPRAAARASAFLDYYTQGRAAAHPDLEALQMACCALAERYAVIDMARALGRTALTAAGDGDGIESETVGAYSVTRREGSARAAGAEKLVRALEAGLAPAARAYLAGTGLISRGGRCLACSRRTP